MSKVRQVVSAKYVKCSVSLLRIAKQNNISIFIIGHVTKDGTLAGPRVLEHIVDTVLYFEGERNAEISRSYVL